MSRREESKKEDSEGGLGNEASSREHDPGGVGNLPKRPPPDKDSPRGRKFRDWAHGQYRILGTHNTGSNIDLSPAAPKLRPQRKSG